MTGNACARCGRAITSDYSLQAKRAVAGILVALHNDCARQHDDEVDDDGGDREIHYPES